MNPQYDINRAPKMVIEHKRYFMKNTFRYFATNEKGAVDIKMKDVIDGGFKDLFKEKKIFTRLYKSGFAPDTFDLDDCVTFDALVGLFDVGENVYIIKQLIQMNQQIRIYSKKIKKHQNNKRKAHDVSKMVKKQDALCKDYKRCIKKMRKRYNIDALKGSKYDYVEDFLNSKKDDFGWFDDYEDYQWGDGPRQGGRFSKMMKAMSKDERAFYQSMGDIDPYQSRSRQMGYPGDLSQVSYKMNNFPLDDEDDDDDDMGILDIERFQPRPGDGVGIDSEALQEIYDLNPELAQRSMDGLLGKKSMDYPLSDYMDDEDDDEDEDILDEPIVANRYGKPEPAPSDTTTELLKLIVDRLADLDEAYSEIPSTEGIAEAINKSQETTMKFMNVQLTGIVNKVNQIEQRVNQVSSPVTEEVKDIDVTELPDVKHESVPTETVVEAEEVKAEVETSATLDMDDPIIMEETPNRVMLNNNERVVLEDSVVETSDPIIDDMESAVPTSGKAPKQLKSKSSNKNVKIVK